MKKINYALAGLIGSAVLFSCGENNPMKKIKEAKDAMGAVSELVSAGSGAMKDVKKLSELEPLSHQDFEKWMPGESFRGLERTEIELGEALAQSSVKLVYGSSSGGKRLEIVVIDGADPVGGHMVVTQLNMFLNSDMMQKEIENHGEDKIVNKHGQKAMESYSGGENILQTLVNDRFFVKLSGYDMEIDEVWDAFKALKVDKLK